MRASFGTAKYCISFLRSVTCTNNNCLDVHEWGESDDCFTREELATLYVFRQLLNNLSHNYLGNIQSRIRRSSGLRQLPRNMALQKVCFYILVSLVYLHLSHSSSAAESCFLGSADRTTYFLNSNHTVGPSWPSHARISTAPSTTQCIRRKASREREGEASYRCSSTYKLFCGCCITSFASDIQASWIVISIKHHTRCYFRRSSYIDCRFVSSADSECSGVGVSVGRCLSIVALCSSVSTSRLGGSARPGTTFRILRSF